MVKGKEYCSFSLQRLSSDSYMDSPPNPGPKTPQEDLDKETELIHGTIIGEELFNLQEIKWNLEEIEVLLQEITRKLEIIEVILSSW